MGYTVIAKGSEEPVNLTEAKEQCKVDGTEEDNLIQGLISSARASAEHYTGLTLIQKRIKEYYNTFPTGGEGIELTFAPVREVKSIQYIDEDGNTQTWATSNYGTDLTEGLPAKVYLEFEKSYPSIRSIDNAVWITYDAGPVNPEDIDPAVKCGMMLEIAEWFDNRKNNRQSPFKIRVAPAQALYESAKRTFL